MNGRRRPVAPDGLPRQQMVYRVPMRPARRITIGRLGYVTPAQTREIAQEHAFQKSRGVDPMDLTFRHLGFQQMGQDGHGRIEGRCALFDEVANGLTREECYVMSIVENLVRRNQSPLNSSAK